LYLARIDFRRWGGRFRPGWDKPELGCRFFSEPAINRNDSGGINAARVHQIVFGEVGTGLSFAGPATASAVDDDVNLRGGVVLQLYGEIVETCLLFVTRDPSVRFKVSRGYGICD
jgi:hypothetical protein